MYNSNEFNALTKLVQNKTIVLMVTDDLGERASLREILGDIEDVLTKYKIVN